MSSARGLELPPKPLVAEPGIELGLGCAVIGETVVSSDRWNGERVTAFGKYSEAEKMPSDQDVDLKSDCPFFTPITTPRHAPTFRQACKDCVRTVPVAIN